VTDCHSCVCSLSVICALSKLHVILCYLSHTYWICTVFVVGAAVAGVYRASGFSMTKMYALVWGVGQTIIVIFISFTRILATLWVSRGSSKQQSVSLSCQFCFTIACSVVATDNVLSFSRWGNRRYLEPHCARWLARWQPFKWNGESWD